jgi:hypothetical protein
MIDRIKISKEIMIGGLKMWLGAEATVTPGEDPLKEMHKAEDTLNNYVSVRHGIGTPMEETLPLYPVQVQEEKPTDRKQYLLDLIKVSTTEKGLSRFLSQIEEFNDAEVTWAFNNKLEILKP